MQPCLSCRDKSFYVSVDFMFFQVSRTTSRLKIETIAPSFVYSKIVLFSDVDVKDILGYSCKEIMTYL